MNRLCGARYFTFNLACYHQLVSAVYGINPFFATKGRVKYLQSLMGFADTLSVGTFHLALRGWWLCRFYRDFKAASNNSQFLGSKPYGFN